jgi:hypothetical protein
MTTLIITDNDVGRTVATDGAITYVRCLSIVAPGEYPPPDKAFTLVDDFAAGPQKVLIRLDVPTNGAAVPLGIGGEQGFNFYNVLLDGQLIQFQNLTVASCPERVSFRIDYDPVRRVVHGACIVQVPQTSHVV